MIEKVSVVFHGAATLRLEASVKDAVIQNTLGTKRVLELCQQIINIEVKYKYINTSSQFYNKTSLLFVAQNNLILNLRMLYSVFISPFRC